ncbi:uncharacterized protein N7473_005114 [Penicillium subrubescens]|uniref:uncharacterized protein n=1 Tax=Penicillium subrubescens TaxID=1316194 RepID=UPI0025455F6B|nr:uncharacterized protein N7473_005114 [Penicillium subrubescens]KAJ5895715.1 hypothetical protein N7473_005114 [Penicillium subrubescens]
MPQQSFHHYFEASSSFTLFLTPAQTKTPKRHSILPPLPLPTQTYNLLDDYWTRLLSSKRSSPDGTTTAPVTGTRSALSPILVQEPSLDRYTIFNGSLGQPVMNPVSVQLATSQVVSRPGIVVSRNVRLRSHSRMLRLSSPTVSSPHERPTSDIRESWGILGGLLETP